MAPTAPAAPAATAPAAPALAPVPRGVGLTSAEARARAARDGPNELAPARRLSALRETRRALASPLMLILLAAGLTAGALGERVDAAIIVLMVALSVLLNVVQTTRSQRAADLLRGSVAPAAVALRDGAWATLPRRALVRGDVIRLGAGDLVPADARLLESRDLHVQQATLTGESMPAEKEAPVAGPPAATSAAAAPDDDPHRRDLLFLGTSVVSGTATALVTATGAHTSFGALAARLAAPPPETAFDRGLRDFGGLISRTVVFLVLFLVLASIVLRRDPLSSLLFAVALAVGLVPEFMPMITSVTLANGAVRMARERVIVKHLGAIQNLGGVDVLCSDKTGTITSGEMRLERAVDAAERPSPSTLALARLNARFETGIRSPLDDAILRAPPPPDGEDGAGWEKLDEMPFDFERRRTSIVARRGDERLLVVKGAPETVLPRCASIAPADRARLDTLAHRWGDEGLRVLAVATRVVEPRAAYAADDERDLVLAGFLGFVDAPLADAGDAIAALRADGVAVKILTGDEASVARYVCTRAGIASDALVLGDALDDVSDAALGALAERTTVFARLSPRQKLRVVLALKARGHVVGYLGDGVNDAPSLHAADVGISVANAVDVARDAADVILLERRLRVLHTGILEGRKAFGNVVKYLLMGTSSGLGNMLSMAAGSLVLPFLPMLPTQILLNNFLYDLAQVAIPTDRVDEEYVRKPHHWDVGAIRRFMLAVGPVSSAFDVLTFVVLLRVFHAGEVLFHTGWFVESLATQVLVLFVIRTRGNPLRSRPSRAFGITALAALAVGVSLPFTPFRAALGFAPLGAAYVAFTAAVTATYLACAEWAKRRVMPRLLA